MGNYLSCCVNGESSGSRRNSFRAEKYRTAPNGSRGGSNGVVRFPTNYVNRNAGWLKEEESANNLQHISEREPNEDADDPSLHPTKQPTFMERSQSELKLKDTYRRSMYLDLDMIPANNIDGKMISIPSRGELRFSCTGEEGNGRACGPVMNDIISNPRVVLQKASSCSTIFIDDSTVSQPNLRNTLKCISLAVYYHIVNRQNRDGGEQIMDIFDEQLHPLSKESLPPDYAQIDPEHRHIYRFIRTLFTAAQLTAECAIITLVYIERLLTYAEIDICPANWRRIVLGAILLASKVWDDQAVWNVDYCQILKQATVEDMNELERQFLECLQFNINVPSSVYAKYYFDLRTLALVNDLQLPLQPLYKERAKKLEAMCRTYEDKVLEHHCSKERRRCLSLDRGRRVKNRHAGNTVVLS